MSRQDYPHSSQEKFGDTRYKCVQSLFLNGDRARKPRKTVSSPLLRELRPKSWTQNESK